MFSDWRVVWAVVGALEGGGGGAGWCSCLGGGCWGGRGRACRVAWTLSRHAPRSSRVGKSGRGARWWRGASGSKWAPRSRARL